MLHDFAHAEGTGEKTRIHGSANLPLPFHLSVVLLLALLLFVRLPQQTASLDETGYCLRRLPPFSFPTYKTPQSQDVETVKQLRGRAKQKGNRYVPTRWARVVFSQPRFDAFQVVEVLTLQLGHDFVVIVKIIHANRTS
jgi:hypothetical protein